MIIGPPVLKKKISKRFFFEKSLFGIKSKVRYGCTTNTKISLRENHLVVLIFAFCTVSFPADMDHWITLLLLFYKINVIFLVLDTLDFCAVGTCTIVFTFFRFYFHIYIYSLNLKQLIPKYPRYSLEKKYKKHILFIPSRNKIY